MIDKSIYLRATLLHPYPFRSLGFIKVDVGVDEDYEFVPDIGFPHALLLILIEIFCIDH